MIECAIQLVIYAIIILAVLFTVRTVIEAFGVAIPKPFVTLFAVLGLLLVLLLALRCFAPGVG